VISKTLWVRSKARAVLHAWLLGLTPIVNIYLTMLVGFVAVINNPTDINASSYGYLNVLGPILITLWLVGLVVLLFKGRVSTN
ncbi:MAG: hypothetical protein AAFN93_29035, partial [Bacteroidota bacterium]